MQTSTLISNPPNGSTLAFTNDLDDAFVLEISNDFGEFIDVDRDGRLFFDRPDGRLPSQALTSTGVEQSENLPT